MIEIVSATRLSQEAFLEQAPLGISLRRFAKEARVTAMVAFDNSRPLPEVFNARIEASPHEMLAFIHDDVWVDDLFLANRVIEGLQAYDVIGVAGSRARLRDQPAWAFHDLKFTWLDRSQLSGAVGHGNTPAGAVSWYGETPAACELLDGVFIAARRSTLMEKGVRFDPQFAFHFYDMDFCRSAREAGLRLGTWPIALTHRSGGSFGTDAWQKLYWAYLNKWGE